VIHLRWVRCPVVPDSLCSAGMLTAGTGTRNGSCSDLEPVSPAGLTGLRHEFALPYPPASMPDLRRPRCRRGGRARSRAHGVGVTAADRPPIGNEALTMGAFNACRRGPETTSAHSA